MKLALGLLLLLPLTSRAELIFVDYAGTVSFDNPEIDPHHTYYTVGEHVAGRLIIDTALASSQGITDQGGAWGPAAIAFQPPYPGFVFAPSERLGDGYDSYDGVGMCKDCIPDGAGGSLDKITIENDFFSIDIAKHDFIDHIGLDQSFNFTAADVRGPGESMSARVGPGPDEGYEDRLADFVLSHLSMRSANCSAPK